MDKKAHWLEVSLTVDGEWAEALVPLLSHFVMNGVVTETPVAFDETEENYVPTGKVRVFGYLPIDEHIEENRQKLLESLWHMSQIRELPEPTFRKVEDENWMEAWKEHYHPIRVGERILILPAWIDEEDPDRESVKIDPCMAFGTGTHPSTQLCLMLLESYIKPGMKVIDIGCGSGILSIAAVKLGAEHALAVDIDQAAVMATRENGEANHVLDLLEIGLGSVKEIRDGQFSLITSPLVIANILTPVIIHLFEDGLADLIHEDGVLLLAGILEEQVEKIEDAATGHGLALVGRLQSDDWVGLAYQKKSALEKEG